MSFRGAAGPAVLVCVCVRVCADLHVPQAHPRARAMRRRPEREARDRRRRQSAHDANCRVSGSPGRVAAIIAAIIMPTVHPKKAKWRDV